MNLIDLSAEALASAIKINPNFTEVQSAIAAMTIPIPPGAATSGFVNIKDYGAAGNGTTDDTAAIQAGYNAACAIKGTLLFPAGTYVCSGIDLGGVDHRGCTLQGAAFDGRGNGWISSRLLLKACSNRPLFRYLAGEAPTARFKNLILDGNGENQTANEYIVKADDDLVTGYPYGIHMDYVFLVNGRGGGLYLGKRRGGNYLANVLTYNNGFGNSGHGISVDTYDVTMYNCHLGVSSGYGLNLISGSQLELTSVNSYMNQLGGVYIGAGVSDVTYMNGSIDRNVRFGVNSAKRTSANYVGGRVFIGTKFLGNCSGSDGSFPDVLIAAGDTDFRLLGCSFMGGEGTYKPGHALYFMDGAATAQIAACRFNAASAWKWAIANLPTSLILDNRIS